jgi:hypothetical protein
VLKEGRAVLNKDGVEIPPSLCVTPEKPGRVVALLPTLDHPDELLLKAKGADLLIANVATGELDQQAEELGGLGLRAQQLGVKSMAVTGMVGAPPEHPWGWAKEDVGEIAWTKFQQGQEGGLGRAMSGEAAAAADFAVYPPSAAAVKAIAATREVFAGRVFLPEDGIDLILEEHKGREEPEAFDFEAMAEEKRAPGMECSPLHVAEYTGLQSRGAGDGSDFEDEGRGSKRRMSHGGGRGDRGGRFGGRGFESGRAGGRGEGGRGGGRSSGRGQGMHVHGRGRGGFGRGSEQVYSGNERPVLATAR